MQNGAIALYPEGTEVKSFARDDLKANAELIEKVQQELLAPGNNGLEGICLFSSKPQGDTRGRGRKAE